MLRPNFPVCFTRNLWRGWRIAMFARASDIAFVLCPAAMAMVGRSLKPAAGIDFHSQGQTTTATTFIVPCARRFMARLYSIFQQ